MHDGIMAAYFLMHIIADKLNFEYTHDALGNKPTTLYVHGTCIVHQ